MSFLIVPMEGDGLSPATAFRPKYISGVTFRSCCHDGVALVWAALTSEQEASISANADVILVPPLDNTVAVNATKNALEALNIPAQWVTSGMTYRQVVRVIAGFFQLLQRMNGRKSLLSLQGNLDKTMSQLPVQIRTDLAAAADDLGLNRTSIVASTTLREALRIAGQQFLTKPFGEA